MKVITFFPAFVAQVRTPGSLKKPTGRGYDRYHQRGLDLWARLRPLPQRGLNLWARVRPLPQRTPAWTGPWVTLDLARASRTRRQRQ